MLLQADRSALLVIDVQARLLPAVHERQRVIDNVRRLTAGAQIFDVPILVSEQYPKGLGPTAAALEPLPDAALRCEKTAFSCVRDAAWREAWGALDRPQAVVVGIEAHVCVLQTAIDLLGRASQVFVVADAISSRTPQNHRLALDRMRQDGARIVSAEMVLFEWAERAATDRFRRISELVK